MANWGEFMREFKIVNMKSQGIFVKVDEVLDMYDERQKLREEVAQLRDQLVQEREACARDVDEFAQACAAEPDQPEYLATVLQAAAELIRGRAQTQASAEAPPMAEEVPAAEVPPGEAIPTAEPMPPGEEYQS